MKKNLMLIIFILLSIGMIASAATINKTLTFEWEQNAADLPYLKEWRLFWSETSDGPYDNKPVAIIPYNSSMTPPFQASASPIIEGEPGSIVRKYFVMVAVGDLKQQDGTTKTVYSNNSNEVFYDFVITIDKFSAPINFKIKVN